MSAESGPELGDEEETAEALQTREELSSFPVFELDWSAYEELKLIEAVEKYGIGNWEEVAKHVETKSWVRCQKHYLAVYLESPSAPYADERSTLLNIDPEIIPDSAHSAATNTTPPVSEEEQSQQEGRKVDTDGDVDMTAGESSKADEDMDQRSLRPQKNSNRDSSVAEVTNAMGERYLMDTSKGGTLEGGEASIYIEEGDELNIGDEVVDRDGNVVGPVTNDISGYMPLRDDFDVEHNNDAEAVIADMEFHEGEHPTETQLKLKILEIYNGKLDERERRKQFVKERGLLDYRRQLVAERRKPRFERDIRNQFRPFARFVSPDEWEDLVQGFVAERRLRKRIDQLQKYRGLGIRTLAEAEEYESMKKKRDTQIALSKQRERDSYLYDKSSTPAKRGRPSASTSRSPRPTPSPSPSSEFQEPVKDEDSSEEEEVTPMRTNEGLGRGRSSTRARRGRPPLRGRGRRGKALGKSRTRNRAKDRGKTVAGKQASEANDSGAEQSDDDENGEEDEEIVEENADSQPSSLDGAPGMQELNQKEKELCRHLQVLPSQYVSIKEAILEAALKKGYLARDEAGNLVSGEKNTAQQVYDFCVSCGWVNADANNLQPPPSTRYNTLPPDDSTKVT